MLAGAKVVNNPFWWNADDKFFNYSLATYLGIAVPKTILLPQKEYKDGVVAESLRNLEYPLNWEGIIDHVGLPAFIKPFDGGGSRGVSRRETIQINEALGYDINTVEFAIVDGIPYAIDYMNPAPDADWWSVGSVYFKWLVDKVADLAIETALHGEPTLASHRWDELLKNDIKWPSLDKPAGAK